MVCTTFWSGPAHLVLSSSARMIGAGNPKMIL